ncbi:hypothetical protein B2G71_06320 [Novosphingobium sp. PC22D]|uniref:PaaI family thioesterase n=1 Tax=Novosphingobium sp. PC22D TaxID=1962403 RepID=UPI000BEFB53E|nr:PaaI family thioesterase [Novosphingobium sp. PC22D]PEQ13911.1 hypothetical protein B2G71_06320 [Novosphingobium sp. PC22D]
MSAQDITLPAYAGTIGVRIDSWDAARPILTLDYSGELCGNPGMFHGGAVAALLEMAALATIDADLRAGRGPAKLSPVNATVEYMRPALERPAYASARIVRAGRRLANLEATLWQESEDKPCATAIVNVAIAPLEAA